MPDSCAPSSVRRSKIAVLLAVSACCATLAHGGNRGDGLRGSTDGDGAAGGGGASDRSADISSLSRTTGRELLSSYGGDSTDYGYSTPSSSAPSSAPSPPADYASGSDNGYGYSNDYASGDDNGYGTEYAWGYDNGYNTDYGGGYNGGYGGGYNGGYYNDNGGYGGNYNDYGGYYNDYGGYYNDNGGYSGYSNDYGGYGGGYGNDYISYYGDYAVVTSMSCETHGFAMINSTSGCFGVMLELCDWDTCCDDACPTADNVVTGAPAGCVLESHSDLFVYNAGTEEVECSDTYPCICDLTGGGGGSCPYTCYGFTCDDWVYNGQTCNSLEAYGCDCAGCWCGDDDGYMYGYVYGEDASSCDDTASTCPSVSTLGGQSYPQGCVGEISLGDSITGTTYSGGCNGIGEDSMDVAYHMTLSEASAITCGGDKLLVSTCGSAFDTYLHVFQYDAPVYTGCASDLCGGETCDYWIDQGFSCDDISSCDCSGCTSCNSGSYDEIFSEDNTGSEFCVSDGSCPSTCFGQSCDSWLTSVGSCPLLETEYACDCSGCGCGVQGKLTAFETYLNEGEYIIVVEGFEENVGMYELSVECMTLTGLQSVDVASAVVLSGLTCDAFGTAEESVFISSMATTMGGALGGTIAESDIHTVTCDDVNTRRRRRALSSMVEIGFTATLAAATFFDDDTGEDMTSVFQANLLSVLDTGELASNLASSASDTVVGNNLVAASVEVAASMTTVTYSTTNMGTANFDDTPSPTTLHPTPKPTTPAPTNPTPMPSPLPTSFPTTCTETPDPTVIPTSAPTSTPTVPPTPAPTGSFMQHISPAFHEVVRLGEDYNIEWLARGDAMNCPVTLEVVGNGTTTTAVINTSHVPNYDDNNVASLTWTINATKFGVFEGMYSWMRVSCVDPPYYLTVSSPFELAMTSAPTPAPTAIPAPIPTFPPSLAPTATPTPNPTTATPTQMPTLYPTPVPSFSPTPYATTLIVPQKLSMDAIKPARATAELFLVNLERNDQQFNITANFEAIELAVADAKTDISQAWGGFKIKPSMGTTATLDSRQVTINITTTGLPSGTYDISVDVLTSSSTWVDDADSNNPLDGEYVYREQLTNIPIKLVVAATANALGCTVEITDGPTLGVDWTGLRVVPRDSDGYPTGDVSSAGQSFSATLAGGGMRQDGTCAEVDGICGTCTGCTLKPVITQACTSSFDSDAQNYQLLCTLPDTGIVGDWALKVLIADGGDDGIELQGYPPTLASYCPSGYFARVSGAVINANNLVKDDNKGPGSATNWQDIADDQLSACIPCHTVPGLRCGDFDFDGWELCEPGPGGLTKVDCKEWYENSGEYTGQSPDLDWETKYLDPATDTCACPVELEKQSAARLTTLSLTLLPNYWRAFAWSEKVWPCVKYGGCHGDVNSTDVVTKTCGMSMAGSPTATNSSDGVCAGAVLYQQMQPYESEVYEKFADKFAANNPHLSNCPDCFTLGPMVDPDRDGKVCDADFTNKPCRAAVWDGGAYNDAYCKCINTGPIDKQECYTGPLCSVCAQDFYPKAQKCFVCNFENMGDTFLMLGLFAGVVLCVGGIVGGLILKKKENDKKQMLARSSSFIKEKKKQDNIIKLLVKENKLKAFMLVVTFQVLYQFHQVTAAAAKMTEEPDRSFPTPAKEVVEYLQVFNFEFLQWIPPACVKPGADFYDTLMTKTILPLILIGVIVLVSVLKLMRPSTRKNQRKRDKAIAGAVQGVSLLIELVLPSVTTTICQAFVCDLYDDFPIKGALRADNTLMCDPDSGDRFFWEWYATLMMIIYPVLMPCILVGIFYANRKEIDKVMSVWKQHDEECIARGESTAAWTIQEVKTYMALEENGGHEVSGSVMALAPNFMKFDPSCWWMGTFLLVVRIFQTSLLIFLSDPEVQSTFGAFISLICVCTLREFEPYRIDSDDTVGVLAQWMLFIFMSILLLVRVHVVDKIPPVLLGTALMLIVFGLLGISGKSIYNDYKNMVTKVQPVNEAGAAGGSEEDKSTEITALVPAVPMLAAGGTPAPQQPVMLPAQPAMVPLPPQPVMLAAPVAMLPQQVVMMQPPTAMQPQQPVMMQPPTAMQPPIMMMEAPMVHQPIPIVQQQQEQPKD